MYVLVSMSAAYFAVLTIIPAALYVGLERRERWAIESANLDQDEGPLAPGIRRRGRAGSRRDLLRAPLAATHGFSLKRTRASFDSSGAPLWGYVTQGFAHRTKALRLFDVFGQADGFLTIENSSYLGLDRLLPDRRSRPSRGRNSGTPGSGGPRRSCSSSSSCGTSWTIAGRDDPAPGRMALGLRADLPDAPDPRAIQPAGLRLGLDPGGGRASGSSCRRSDRRPRGMSRSSSSPRSRPSTCRSALPNTPIDVPPAPRAYAFIKDRDPEGDDHRRAAQPVGAPDEGEFGLHVLADAPPPYHDRRLHRGLERPL